MNKKLIIVASIPLVAGVTLLTWVLDQRRQDRESLAEYKSLYAEQADDFVRQYNEWLQLPPQERTELPLLMDKDGKAKSRELLRQEQQGRFKANVDKLIAGVVTNPSLADLLYGDNWQDELNKYKQRKAFNRTIFVCSIVSASTGGMVYLVWLLLVAARLMVIAAKGFGRLFGHAQTTLKKGKAAEPEENAECVLEELDDKKEEQDEPQPRPKIAVKPAASITSQRERRPMGSLTRKLETSVKQDETGELIAEKVTKPVKAHNVREPVRLDLHEAPKPIDNTLNDLTEQVSAIREYAANQQDRLEKLQDGYDWNIIRTFCLRVIRCVDNLDNRIAQLDKKNALATHLEEIKDELIFALESSGIEQFEPEINTEYRGQEKYAEAVKDKLDCDDSEQSGKIAIIVRPGYQYFINEENVKIVRPAQVRLYA